MVNNQHRVTAIFSALADPIRRGILASLAKQGEEPVMVVGKPYRVSAPAISRHLRVLEKARLIRRRRDGRVHLLRLRPEALAPAQDWMAQCAAGWEFSFDTLDELLRKDQK
jgi:DNA-binding transcriptional ArsR family regulator